MQAASGSVGSVLYHAGERGRECADILARGQDPCGAIIQQLTEFANPRGDHRAAECQRLMQHGAALDFAVREHSDAARRQYRCNLIVRDEARLDADLRGKPVLLHQAVQRAKIHVRLAHDAQPRLCFKVLGKRGKGPDQDVRAFVGLDLAEQHEGDLPHHGVRRIALGRPCRSLRHDHDPTGWHALRAQPLFALLGMDDEAVKACQAFGKASRLQSGGRVAIEGVGVMHGQHQGGDTTQRRQHAAVHHRQRQPLEVDDVWPHPAQAGDQPHHGPGMIQPLESQPQTAGHGGDRPTACQAIERLHQPHPGGVAVIRARSAAI